MAKSSKPAHALTREQFRTHAKPVTVVINGKEMTGAAKEFSTGSLGWNINEKMQVDVGGQTVTVQVGLNLTIVGSKDIPHDAHSAPPSAAESPKADPPAAKSAAAKSGTPAASPADGEESASGRADAATGQAEF